MFTWRQIGIVIVVTAISLPVYGNPGKDAYNRGLQAERLSNYDLAFVNYKQAYTLAPTNARYFTAYTRVRFNATTQHIHTGEMLRNTGALPAAVKEFQRAMEIDASSFLAQQELRITEDLIQRQERERLAPKIEPVSAKVRGESPPVIELQPLSSAAITLHMTTTADVAYKTIGKLAGLNVVVDPDLKGPKMTVDLTDVTLLEALNLIRLQSKTFWRPVLPNTILVAADSPGKRKELEQNVMRTFYLKNISTPAELQDAANLVKQMLEITHVQLLQAQDALVLRGTPDQMVLAEKLLADVDKPKSEVILDITVMQVSRDRARTLGTNVPTSTSIGYLPAITSGSSSSGTSSGGTSSGGSTASTPSGTVRLGSFEVSVPGASFQFLASDSNTKILQSPRIRALNDEKATLRIGDRVPVATGSYQAGVGSSVSPLVSTQFTYLDVGVNIDITPHIHSDNEVTLKMMLEISSVTGQQDIGGITEPVIGQRRIEHETRLTDGEVNLLGGILEDSETKSLSGYPWLSKIPILRYLFAQDNRDRSETEIVFAITPHIVRALNVTEENTRLIDVGTGNSIELRHKAPTAASSEPEHPADPAKQPAAPQSSLPGTPTAGSSRPRASLQSAPKS